MLVSQRQCERSAEAQVEDYLDHFIAPLVGTVPYERRCELRAELTAHLEALVEARVELGESREDAIAGAMRQFGNPAKIGSEWLGEWRPNAGFPLHTVRLAAACFFPASVAYWLLGVIRLEVTPATLFLLLTLLPTFAGFAVGLLARNRPASGALFAVLGLALITGILGLVETFALGRFDQPGTMLLGGLAAIEAIIWAPLGSIAALAGGAVRRRVLTALRAVGSI